MTFDMGFDFRATLGFTTDPAYGVQEGAFSYPHTYTNANGDSINAGWMPITGNSQDLVGGNDPRIVGDVYSVPSTESIFRVDLNSGSAPGAGAYTVDVAIGQPGGAQTVQFALKDGTTTYASGGPTSLAANHFLDATNADVAATTIWTGTPVARTFVSTDAYVYLNPGGTNANFSLVAHFRLTLASGTSTNITPNTGSVVSAGYQPTLTGQTQIVTVFSNLGDQGFIAFQAQAINKVEASLDGVTYHNITALGRAVAGEILFSHVAFFFYRVTSVGAIVYTTGTDKAVIN